MRDNDYFTGPSPEEVDAEFAHARKMLDAQKKRKQSKNATKNATKNANKNPQ
jgi:hypothetical protein